MAIINSGRKWGRLKVVTPYPTDILFWRALANGATAIVAEYHTMCRCEFSALADQDDAPAACECGGSPCGPAVEKARGSHPGMEIVY